MIDNNRFPERLVRSVATKECVPFVGAGLSKQADDEHFPNWDQLLQRMIQDAEGKGYIEEYEVRDLRDLLHKHKPLMVAESLKVKLPSDYYYEFLESQFDPPDILPAEAHEILLEFNSRMIITTNYDRLIENAYARICNKAMTVMNYSDSGKVQRRLQSGRKREQPFLYKIHGDIEDVASIVLNESDYRRILYDEIGYQSVLPSIFIHYTVLFMGFSLSDQELLLHLSKLRHALKGGTAPDYILLQEGECNTVECERLRQDFGLEVLPYAAGADHRELVEYLRDLVATAQEIGETP